MNSSDDDPYNTNVELFTVNRIYHLNIVLLLKLYIPIQGCSTYIQTSRYSYLLIMLNIPREQRLCSHCKCIDDEKHFLLHCTINSELRSSFLNILNNENQIFNNLSESEKLSYILNPSTPSQVNKLGSFLKKSLELKTGDS